MLKLDTPLLLSPVFKSKIWGRNNLSPFFGARKADEDNHQPLLGRKWRPPAEMGRVGEVWITDTASRFLNGPVSGKTLGQVSRDHPTALHGSSWPRKHFPILAKYLFTTDWLSVQVHPDDRAARRLNPGESGKGEMWHFMSGGERSEFLLGAKPGTTVEAFRQACESGKSKNLLNRFRARPGEAVYVPPGTVHALGPNLVLFEVEQNSDLTYRLDDYGRKGLEGKPRPLHLDKGMEVLRLDHLPRRNLPRLKFREQFGWRRYILACPYFALEELTLTKMGQFEGNREHVEVLSIASGEGRVDTAAGWMGYFTGDTWLIPPGVRDYRLAPRAPTRILKFYLPDLDRDFRRPLARKHVKKAEIEKIVFD